MSYQGQSPSVKRTRFTPQSADPVSPLEGDFYYSDGTARAEGLWYYSNATWKILLSDTSTLDTLTITPRSSDPSSPVLGMFFVSDGTSRDAGLWEWDGTGWVQLSRMRSRVFTFQPHSGWVNVATTQNITIATELDPGDTIDGVVLTAGDTVLVKHQSTASENGVWIVPATIGGTKVRASSWDTAAELSRASIKVYNGTAGGRKIFVQNNYITSLSDSQVWSEVPVATPWVVPAGVYEIMVSLSGPGGGAGAGAAKFGLGLTIAGSGGGGGGGSSPKHSVVSVTPGETINVLLGRAGRGARGTTASGAQPSGEQGTPTTVVCSARTLYGDGALGGVGGTGASINLITGITNIVGAAGAADIVYPRLEEAGGGSTGAVSYNASGNVSTWGATGNGEPSSYQASSVGAAGYQTLTGSTGDGGYGNPWTGGGGGGNGVSVGGQGGAATSNNNTAFSLNSAATEGADGFQASGGGGGGAGSGVPDATAYYSATAYKGQDGGWGGHGWVKITW